MIENSSHKEMEVTLQRLAQEIRTRRMELPAILFLESHKPLRNLAFAFLSASAPLVLPLVGAKFVKSMLSLLESPEHVDLLINLLDREAQTP